MPRPAQHLLINRNYARLWLGQAISTVGDVVFEISLILWVASVLGAGKSWAPTAVSGVILAAGAAVLCVGPLAGVFVDRWHPLPTMLRTEVVRAGLVGALALIFFIPTEALPAWVWLAVIYLVVFSVNAAGQFFGPARFSIIMDVVTGEADWARAAGISQATFGAATIIGPPLAAPLLFTLGLQWALLVNAISYVVSFFAIRSISPELAAGRDAPTRPSAGLRAEFVDGLRFFAGNRFLLAVLVLVVFGQCAAGTLDTLNVFFLTGNLHASAHLYGYLGAALGAGGILGALCAGRLVRWVGAKTTTWVAFIVGGTLLVLYARQGSLPTAIGLLFGFIIPVTVLNTAMTPLLFAATPREYVGRVMAVLNPVSQLSVMFASMLAGWLAGSEMSHFAGSVLGMHYGPIDTILSVAGLLFVIAGLYARRALPGSPTAAKAPASSTVASPPV